jgi:catecholate siderophore receptor
MITRTMLLSTAAALAFASAARAEVGAADAGEVVRSEEVLVVGKRVEGYAAERIGSATKTDTLLIDTPQSVSVITEDVIRDLSLQGMADLVRLTPGVSMAQGEGHRDAPIVRGVLSTADFYVNGVRDDVQRYRDLYNVSRVEVLKGPNAMIFGRGGGGGVINQVTKQADFAPSGELVLETGSWEHARAVLDVNRPLSSTVAGRVTAVLEDSDSFRDHVGVERRGVNPTITFAPESGKLILRGAYERFEDERTVDRGVSSFRGRPLETDRSTYFGDPDLSFSEYRSDTAFATADYLLAPKATLRARASYGDYDKFYQNVFPGAVNAAGTDVSISAYDNLTRRQNAFGSTDLTLTGDWGGLDHTLLVGVEIGSQVTKNRRATGYFGPLGCRAGSTTVTRPLSNPTLTGVPVAFCLNPTNATGGGDAHVKSSVRLAAIYVQDQIAFGPWRIVAGLRFDRFDAEVDNYRVLEVAPEQRRAPVSLSRADDLVSPRLGLIYKPSEAASIYGSWSVSHLPSSGEQFSSLTPTQAGLEPEKFENLEVGAKWSPRPGLNLSAALYQLERTNTTAPDPNQPGRLVLTGAQRSRGLELEAAGRATDRWEVIGGLALQEAEITSRTTAAAPGQKVPLVPDYSVSLWNKVRVTDAVSAGLGVIRQGEVFAAIDNAVTLPAFTRVDAAVYWRAADRVAVQLNVENLFDERYFATAHSNTNVMPGRPRAVRASLTTTF